MFHFSFLGPFLSRNVRGEAMMLNQQMNFLLKFVNPRNLCSSLTVVGTGELVTAVTLSWSVNTLSVLLIYPRNEILET